MATMSAAEYQIFTRNDPYTFMHRAFGELNPRSSFLHNWHNEFIASKLEACRRGEITRLIINVQPRSLKSHAAAVSFPAFILGHNPSAQIICASYRQDLANKHSLDCRTLMTSEWYRGLFPTPARTSETIRTGVSDHPKRLPARHFRRRRADRPWSGLHHH